MTTFYLISVDENGDVCAAEIDPALALKLPAVPYSDRIAVANQGDDNLSKANAAQEVIAQVMPDEADEDSQIWAVWHHPIVRQWGDPLPVIGKGSRAEVEDIYFRTIEDPEVDEFYVEFGPCDEDGQPIERTEENE